MSQNQQIPSGSGECPVCHGTGWKIYREAVEGYKEPLELLYQELDLSRQRCMA